jgi:hypothetical protein
MVTIASKAIFVDMACARCNELWRAYAAATVEHVNLLSSQEMAATLRDVESFQTLEARVLEAEARRAAARQAVNQHTSEAHSGTEPTQS